MIGDKYLHLPAEDAELLFGLQAHDGVELGDRVFVFEVAHHRRQAVCGDDADLHASGMR